MVHERCTTNYRSLQVVGTFAGRIDGKPLTLRPTPQRILALLSVTGELSRQDAARLLWPDVHQARALANLRNALWRLRDDGPGFVSEDSGILRLQDVAVDLHEHRRWMRSALTNNLPFQPVLSNGSYEILPGWDEDWLIQPREEFTLLSLYAFEAAGKQSLDAGRSSEAAHLALSALGIDPLRETANRLLIEVHLRDGNHCAAVRQLRKYENLLSQELGIRPSNELCAIVGSWRG
jgi:DNA-binding SARP family transcriptional activator